MTCFVKFQAVAPIQGCIGGESLIGEVAGIERGVDQASAGQIQVFKLARLIWLSSNTQSSISPLFIDVFKNVQPTMSLPIHVTPSKLAPVANDSSISRLMAMVMPSRLWEMASPDSSMF
jgi:hypothetical protein